MKNMSFYCQNCGNETPKWHGKCPACSEWNTIVEELKRAKTNPQTLGHHSTPNQFTHNAWISDNGDYVFIADSSIENLYG